MFLKRVSNWLCIGFFAFGVHLHSAEETPRQSLTRAIEKDDLATVRSLIESFDVGIDELSEGSNSQSPLLEAARYAKVAVINYLVEKEACLEGVSEKGDSPLVKLVQAGRRLSFQQLVDTARLLIDSGASVNGAGTDGYTALMAACEHTRCLELIELLLDRGAFLDAQAKNKSTAYLLALRNNNVNAYRLLVSRGAHTNIDWDGMHPLSVLASDGNMVMAKLLIEEIGADINAYNTNGTTPLIAAVINECTAMIQFLVDMGADINATTARSIDVILSPNGRFSIGKKKVPFPKGCTALNFAKTLGVPAMINLLTDLGGIIYKDVEYREEWYF